LGWKTFSLQSKKKINKKKEYPHFPFTVIWVQRLTYVNVLSVVTDFEIPQEGGFI
jgi:hypothetical protein